LFRAFLLAGMAFFLEAFAPKVASASLSQCSDVAHALLRAASRLSRRLPIYHTRPGVEMSLDTARKSACATSAGKPVLIF
jgi:hypothetical protein